MRHQSEVTGVGVKQRMQTEVGKHSGRRHLMNSTSIRGNGRGGGGPESEGKIRMTHLVSLAIV